MILLIQWEIVIFGTMKNYGILLIIISQSIFSYCQNKIPNFIPKIGLVAYYDFNVNLTDLTSNQNKLTWVNAGYTCDCFGVPKSAIKLNGINNYAELPNSQSLKLDNNFSISVWTYLDSNQNNDDNMIIMRGDEQAGKDPFFLRYLKNKSSILFGQNVSDGLNGSGYGIEYRLDSKYLNRFINLTIVVKASQKKAILYIDGFAKDSIQYKLDNIHYSTENMRFFIGSIQGEWGYFKGAIDNIAIWNRSLNNKEVFNLFKFRTNRQNENCNVLPTIEKNGGIKINLSILDNSISEIDLNTTLRILESHFKSLNICQPKLHFNELKKEIQLSLPLIYDTLPFKNIFSEKKSIFVYETSENQGSYFYNDFNKIEANYHFELSNLTAEFLLDYNLAIGFEISAKLKENNIDFWSDFTGKNTNKIIAFVIDNKIYSAPRVNSQITNGKYYISGNFTEDEAYKLLSRLNYGIIPLKLKINSMNIVNVN